MYVCPLCSAAAEPFYTDSKTTRNYCRCLGCDLTFLEQKFRPSREQEKAEYELHNNDVTDPRYQAFVAPLFEEVIKRHPTPARGLDYGAGPGPVLTRMLEAQGHVMDLYDPIYWPTAGLAEKPYDFVVCCEVAEHFFNPFQEFHNLHGLVAEGGTLAIMTRLMVAEDLFSNWHYRRDPTHVVFYSDATFAWIKQQFGFATLASDGKSVVVLQK